MSDAVHKGIRVMNGSFLFYLKLLRRSRCSNRSFIVNGALEKEKKITAAHFVVLPHISFERSKLKNEQNFGRGRSKIQNGASKSGLSLRWNGEDRVMVWYLLKCLLTSAWMFCASVFEPDLLNTKHHHSAVRPIFVSHLPNFHKMATQCASPTRYVKSHSVKRKLTNGCET